MAPVPTSQMPLDSSSRARAQPFVKLALLTSTALGHALAAPVMKGSQEGTDFSASRHHEEDGPRTTGQLIFDLLGVAGLVLLGGVFAGLTLALMGLDELHLQVLSSSGTDLERRRASKVLRLLAKGKHWVLVVLLLGNVIVNETLPVFLSDFGGGLAAVFTSTVLIVIFGEILPQSVCARYGLAIGAFCAPLVHLTMLVFAPVAWPTAKLLDWCLGEDHGTTYRKAELKTFVSLHQTLGAENLSEDEVTIIRAVLDLNDKTVKDVMTPIEDVYILSSDTILDDEGVSKLVNSGYSRVPVHEPGKKDAILGMLLVKKLIQYDPEDAMPVSWFSLTPLPEASPDLTLLDCLNYFQQGRSHMLLVSSAPGESKGAMGVVTLEDVIEEMIGEEIVDEFDTIYSNTIKVPVQRRDPSQQKGAPGAWAPLIKGIIERRRKFGGPARTPLRSSYGVPASKSSGIPTAPKEDGNAASPAGAGQGQGQGQGNQRAMDKVQIKRASSPTTDSEGQGFTSRRASDVYSPKTRVKSLSRHNTLNGGNVVEVTPPSAGHEEERSGSSPARGRPTDVKAGEAAQSSGGASAGMSAGPQENLIDVSIPEHSERGGSDAAPQSQTQAQPDSASSKSENSTTAAVALVAQAPDSGNGAATAAAAKAAAAAESADPAPPPHKPYIVELGPDGSGPSAVLRPEDIPREASPETSRRTSSEAVNETADEGQKKQDGASSTAGGGDKKSGGGGGGGGGGKKNKKKNKKRH